MAKGRREPKTKPKDAFQKFERLAGKIVRVPKEQARSREKPPLQRGPSK